MREKLQQFMVGRYGADQLSRFLLILAIIFMVVSILFHSPVCNIIAILLIIFCYYRILSKNHSQRYSENMAYLKYSQKASGFFRAKKPIWFFMSKKQYFKQLKKYHIYKCPSCRQKIRIPRGKGKISITCPKCRTEFIKNS